MKIFLFSVLLLAAPGRVRAGANLTDSEAGAISGTLLAAVKQTMESVKDVIAAGKAEASVKEAFARQRAAGRPPRADTAALEAALRLIMRANAGRLGSGNRWRAYPPDQAYAKRAAEVGKALEAHVAELGPIRSWGCVYDQEADLLMNGSIGPLAISGKPGLAAQPDPPPYAETERGFRFGPAPPVMEPEPPANEGSAAWLDWAAAGELDRALTRMRSDSTASESEKAARPRLSPDKARIREAIRLWALAAAAENGAPPPELDAARLDAAAAAVTRAVSRAYGRAASKEILSCRFGDFAAEKVGRAAKRLLAPPPAGKK